MKLSVSLLLVIVLCSSSGPFVWGQTKGSQEQVDVLRVNANEVRLDIVVKDKKGRPVKDLNSPDFEVFEDGVRQEIRSFRFASREAPQANPDRGPDSSEDKSKDTPTTATAASRSTPGVIALVFDRLAPEARSLARKAGMSYTQENMAAGDYTGVFGIDQSLKTYQSFTDNSALVKQAIERATSAATSTYTSGNPRVRELAARTEGLDQQASSSASAASAAGAGRDSAGAAAAGAASGQAAAEQALSQMESSILEQFEVLERDQQGFATINALLAVINPMRKLPGRKTIIFFSEGLALPPSVQMKFPAVISAANRANVSIYAIDSAGLRAESGTVEATRELNSLASQRMQQQARGGDRADGPYTKSLERNEDLLRFDPRGGLGELADETGGVLIHDTNDLSAGLRRINDDMRGYYLITYVPKNEDYNGRFRQINVKVDRSNLEVQTRKGYYAVESVGQLPVLDYEAPAIAAARNARSDSNPFSFRGTALSFPNTDRPGLALMLAEAPMSAFSFVPAADKKTYQADFSVVALIKDQSGQVVQKLSQHYPLSAPLEQTDAARKGELLFYRETQLHPGSYTVELIGYDGVTGKASVLNSPVDIPIVDETKPRLSSVAVLKRAERLTPEEQKRDQPFHFGELLVYPNLGEPIAKSARQLAYFFTAWPAKGSASPLQFTLEILQNRRSLGKSSAPLPAADAQGQIKYASAFPLNEFQPGVYELKVTIDDGKNSVSRSTQFRVVP